MQQSINLLYPATSAISKIKRGPSLLVLILATVFILVCPVVYGYLHYQEMGLISQIVKANADIQELSKPIPGKEVIRPFIAERNDLNQAVKHITETRTVVSKTMDQISKLTDPELTLTSVDVLTQPASMVLSGKAPTHTAVSRFIGNLQVSRYFSNSYLKSSTAGFENNKRTIDFVIQTTPSEGVFK